MSSPHNRQNRYERAARAGEERSRAEAADFLARRPLGRFLAVQFAWGCLGALFGLLIGGWTWAVIDFVLFAGAGILAREVIRRRYAGQGRDTGPAVR